MQNGDNIFTEPRRSTECTMFVPDPQYKKQDVNWSITNF